MSPQVPHSYDNFSYFSIFYDTGNFEKYWPDILRDVSHLVFDIFLKIRLRTWIFEGKFTEIKWRSQQIMPRLHDFNMIHTCAVGVCVSFTPPWPSAQGNSLDEEVFILAHGFWGWLALRQRLHGRRAGWGKLLTSGQPGSRGLWRRWRGRSQKYVQSPRSQAPRPTPPPTASIISH